MYVDTYINKYALILDYILSSIGHYLINSLAFKKHAGQNVFICNPNILIHMYILKKCTRKDY